jgi:hypothetical protein
MTTHHITAGDYADLTRDAVADMDAVFQLWKTNGEPAGKLHDLNPNIPADRRIKHFHLVYLPGQLWTDLNGVGRGPDAASIVEYAADVDRPTAWRFLRDHLDAAARARQPMTKDEIAVQRRGVKTG